MLNRIEVGIDCRDARRLAEFWAAALGYRVGELDADGVFLDLIPPDPRLPVIYLQQVREPKRTKNRVHLDLFVDDPEKTVARLFTLGASAVDRPRTGSDGGWWQVMADPEGNEFCVCKTD